MYQNFSFIFGSIKSFEIVIKIKALSEIQTALDVPKNIVVNSFKLLFIKNKNSEIKKPKNAPIIIIYNQSSFDIFNLTLVI